MYYLVQYTQFCRYPGIGAYNRPTIVQLDLNLQVHFEGNEVKFDNVQAVRKSVVGPIAQPQTAKSAGTRWCTRINWNDELYDYKLAENLNPHVHKAD